MESQITNMTIGEVLGRVAAAINTSNVTSEARAVIVQALNQAGQTLSHMRLGDVLGLVPVTYAIAEAPAAGGERQDTKVVAVPAGSGAGGSAPGEHGAGSDGGATGEPAAPGTKGARLTNDPMPGELDKAPYDAFPPASAKKK